MQTATTFGEVLDAIEHLPIEQQADLIELMRRRLAERGRAQVVSDTEDARREHAAGGTRTASVDEIMREIEA
jgi:hypothetical protein